jgi:hypothetical protein
MAEDGLQCLRVCISHLGHDPIKRHMRELHGTEGCQAVGQQALQGLKGAAMALQG